MAVMELFGMLSPEETEQGFRLVLNERYYVNLLRRGKVLATFDPRDYTAAELRAEVSARLHPPLPLRLPAGPASGNGAGRRAGRWRSSWRVLAGAAPPAAVEWVRRRRSVRTLNDYTIVIRPDDNGTFAAHIPALAGCHASGPTPDDARAALAVVFDRIREEYGAAGRSLPEDVHVTVNPP